MKRRIGLCLTVLCLMLAGCEKMPEEVKQRMETYQENEQREEEEAAYCTVEELRAASMEQVFPKPDNLELPQSVDFGEVEEIDLLTFRYARIDRGERQMYEEIFDFPAAEWDTVEDPSGVGWQMQADAQDAKKYMALKENGFNSYLGGEIYENIIAGESEHEVTEKINVLQEREKMVVMQGKEKAVSDLAMTAENWLNTKMPRGDKMTYRVSDLYVKNFGGTCQMASLFVELNYKGVALSAYGEKAKSRRGNVEMSQIGYGINMDLNDASEVVFFSNGTGELQLTEMERLSSVVSFNSAVQTVSQKLSGFQKVVIDQIRVLYVLYPQYKGEERSLQYQASGNYVLGRPVYAFLIKYGEDDPALGISKGNAYCHIYVDMESGEIETDLEEKRYRR